MKRLDSPVKIWDFTETQISERFSLKHPSDVAFINEEVIAVADSETHRVVLINTSKNTHHFIGDGNVWPNCVTVTRDHKLVISDRKDKQVKVYDMRGDLLTRISPHLPEEIPFCPHGVAVDSQGHILVSDTGRQLVYAFTKQGQMIKSFGTSGHLLKELTLPFYCAVDATDNIYISDNRNFAIKKFDHQGFFLSAIGSGQDWGERRFQCPYGIDCDHQDNIILADHGHGSVRILDQTGEYFTYVTARSRGEECEGPMGVAASPRGKVAFTEVTEDKANIKIYKCF